ncbi:phage portal protein [Phocaeicola vulgatus]|uniref:phage portal protein n=1 Tax=Phocaeicola vulgatus TaxID=821 RepID=UPI000A6F0EBF
MTIKEILNSDMTAEQKIAALSEKTVNVPVWGGKKGIEAEYNPLMHPVMDKQKYPDIVDEDGIQPVTRIALGFQKLAAKRMTELVTGIPVRRVFKPENDKQKEIATFIETVLNKNRIDSVNTDRLHRLFAGCEVMTLWYAIEQPNSLYGRESPIKIRCRTFSPMLGDDLYPLFDEYGDMTAMSVGYQRKKGRKNVRFFDTYTATKHIKWSTESGSWLEVENEDITLGKIPAIYSCRPRPIWEDTSSTVFEIEWSLSRNGNYLRENSKPIFCVFADEVVSYGNEKRPEQEAKAVMQYPKGSTAAYVTWQQAVENLKFYVSELRNLYFTMLQLPDWSYEKMSQVALSGESRKQLFIDAQLKVNDEKGSLIEFFDREVNVIKTFANVIFGKSYAADIDALKVDILITPFSISDEKDDINNLMTANGGKPLMSQRESIERYGQSDDVDKTLQEIKEEEAFDSFGMTE